MATQGEDLKDIKIPCSLAPCGKLQCTFLLKCSYFGCLEICDCHVGSTACSNYTYFCYDNHAQYVVITHASQIIHKANKHTMSCTCNIIPFLFPDSFRVSVIFSLPHLKLLLHTVNVFLYDSKNYKKLRRWLFVDADDYLDIIHDLSKRICTFTERLNTGLKFLNL